MAREPDNLPDLFSDLRVAIDAVDDQILALLNRRGTTFRGLAEADKMDLDRAKALRLMQASPSLIRRPVVEDGMGKVTVGFSQPQFAADWGP